MSWFRRLRGGGQERTPAPAGGAPAAEPAPRESARPAAQAPARIALFRADEEAGHPVNLGGSLEGDADLASLLELSHWIEAVALESPDRAGERMLLRIASVLRGGEIRLPAMPEVILEIERMITAPDCRLPELARAIEREPTLATRVVGISNSPFYLGLEPVRSVQDALLRLGMREVRNLVMALALRGRVFQVQAFSAQAHELWEHALTASLAARTVAEVSQVDPDPAFFVGLVHDLGRLVLLSLVGDTQRGQRPGDAIDAALLDSLSDQIHARLGAVVAASWRLAPDLVRAIACHHAPLAAPAGAQELAHVLAVADELAHSVRPQRGRRPDAERGRASAVALGIKPDALQGLNDELEHQLERGLS